MPYIVRGTDGHIVSVQAELPPSGKAEWLSEMTDELLDFCGGRSDAGLGDFKALDQDFIRVIEDLVDLLIQQNVIRMTDLPLEAQRKLLSRKGVRERMRGSAGFLDDSELL